MRTPRLNRRLRSVLRPEDGRLTVPILKPEPPSADELGRLEQAAALAKMPEAGPMRTAAYPHISPDTDPVVSMTYEATVPVLALVMRHGEWPQVVPRVRPFCEQRGIRFTRHSWNPDKLKLNSFNGHLIDILLFETVEDQRTVASAFPGELF
jgi:hypothetical protein